MPSSSSLLCLAVVGLASLVGGCARDAGQLAYRQRLEYGIETPEDMQRFRTPDLERQQRVASAQDYVAQLASPLEMQMMQAAAQGNATEVKAALAQGARVNAADAWGNSALLLAAGKGQLETVRLLLSSGARIEGMDASLTPLASAALHGQAQIVQLLLRKGAKVDATGRDETNALQRAVQQNQLGAARELLLGGASTKTLDSNGSDVLHNAVRDGREAMVALLLAFAADPNSLDADGLSPLYWAEFSGAAAMADQLMAAGARADRKKVVLRKSQPYDFGAN